MLNKIGGYNEIPAKLVKEHPKQGEIVSYRFLHSTVDPITKRTVYPPQVQLRPNASMINPDKPGSRIKVGMVNSVDRDGRPIDQVGPWIYPARSAGVIRLTPNGPDDDLISFLPYSDENASNPNADPSVPKLFELLDYAAEAKKNRAESKAKIDALLNARALSTSEVEAAGLLFGYNINATEDELRHEIEQLAMNKPDEFTKKMSDPDGVNFALVKKAILNGILNIDSGMHSIRWTASGGEFLSVAQTSMDEACREAARYLRESKEGQTVAENLRKEVEAEPPMAIAEKFKKPAVGKE